MQNINALLCHHTLWHSFPLLRQGHKISAHTDKSVHYSQDIADHNVSTGLTKIRIFRTPLAQRIAAHQTGIN